jgi:hydrogenase maturation protease
VSGVVVIGIGNGCRRDDGAGPAVVRAAASLLPAKTRVVELDGEPARVVEAWDGADLAVVVDAVRTGAPPGTVHRFDPARDGVPVPAGTGSSHALGASDAYHLGRALGRLPRRVVIVGVEVADVGPGAGLTPEVAAAVPAAVAAVVGHVSGGGA